MPCVSLYGTRLAWRCEGIAGDPLASLFALSAPPEVEGPARLQVVLRGAGEAGAADARGEGWVPSFFHGIVQAYRGASGFLLHDRASRVLVPDEGLIEAALVEVEREPIPGSTEAMLQIALALALRREGLFHLHAAGALLPSGAPLLVVGASGAGKTTTTLALLEGGCAWLGDDALFLRAGAEQGTVEVLGFPRPFHLGPATLAAFPRLAPLVGAAPFGTEKRPLDARVAYAGRQRSGFVTGAGTPVIALFPRVVDEAVTEVLPIARAEAFGFLIASSAAVVLEGIARRDENLAILRSLLAAARCFEVRLGRDALADPIAAVVARVSAIT